MRRKEYEEELERLQVELVHLQRWIVDQDAKVCIVFEGRDTAGKGGVIKRLTERVSPRVFRVVGLPAPNDRERSQMYMQRYVPHLPAGGEVVIFDRSWYNRAGVEPVMGFCTQEESARFLQLVPFVEQAIVDSGVILLKYWLEVSQEEQTRRLAARIDDGRKTWKLSEMDPKSYGRWYDYSRHVRRDRYRDCALVRGQLRRQAPGPPQHHQPHPRHDPLRARGGGARRPATSPEEGRLPRAAHAHRHEVPMRF